MGATSSFKIEFDIWISDAGMGMTIQKMTSLHTQCPAAFVLQTQALMTDLPSELSEGIWA